LKLTANTKAKKQKSEKSKKQKPLDFYYKEITTKKEIRSRQKNEEFLQLRKRDRNVRNKRRRKKAQL
jgi:beta-xylosidase